jgi:hypothetical protein
MRGSESEGVGYTLSKRVELVQIGAGRSREDLRKDKYSKSVKREADQIFVRLQTIRADLRIHRNRADQYTRKQGDQYTRKPGRSIDKRNRADEFIRKKDRSIDKRNRADEFIRKKDRSIDKEPG